MILLQFRLTLQLCHCLNVVIGRSSHQLRLMKFLQQVLYSYLDGMCGSGTIPVEAGLIACKIPPGKFRNFFGFQRWKDFDEEQFEKIKLDCNNQIVLSPIKIFGSDISEQTLQYAKANVARAGLNDAISLEISD